MPILYEDYAFAPSTRVKDTELLITIVAAYPASSLQIIDIITRKPIPDATVTIDTKTKKTDTSGMVVLDVPDGVYTVKISHPAYWTKTLRITVPMATPATVELIPLWAIGLGIVAGAMVLTVGVTKALKWW